MPGESINTRLTTTEKEQLHSKRKHESVGRTMSSCGSAYAIDYILLRYAAAVTASRFGR